METICADCKMPSSQAECPICGGFKRVAKPAAPAAPKRIFEPEPEPKKSEAAKAKPKAAR